MRLLFSHPDASTLLFAGAALCLCVLSLVGVGVQLVDRIGAGQSASGTYQVELDALESQAAGLERQWEQLSAQVGAPDASADLMEQVRTASVGLDLQVRQLQRSDRQRLQLDMLASFADWLRFRQVLASLGVRPAEEVLEPSGRAGWIRVRGRYGPLDASP